MHRVRVSLPTIYTQHFAISKFSKSFNARAFQTPTYFNENARANKQSTKLQTLKLRSIQHSHTHNQTIQPLIRYRTYTTKKTKAEHKQQEEFDIVIVGGGMVGSALACALASTPITSTQRIAVIESTAAPPLNPLPSLPDLRVSSINLASVDLFKAIGAWDLMTSARVAPYYRIEVWDGSGPGAIHFDNQDSGGAEELGYIIENRVIVGALNERLKQFPNVKIINSLVNSVSQNDPKSHHDDFFNLLTSDERSIKTRLLVGADGANSIVRTFMNKPATGWAYNQRGIVCTVEHTSPNTTAYQRFLPYGPVALLPLFGNFSSIVWSTIPAQQDILQSLSDQDFLEELRKAFTAPVKRVSQLGLDIERMLPTLPSLSESPKPPTIEKIVGPRASFPLRLMHANDYTMHRAVLIGDAAHNVHPLAGQGVNLGFGDVAALTNEIILGLQSGEDIGSEALLRRYQKQRKAANVLMMAGTDGLKRLFDSSFLPLALARNVGLSLTNAFTPLKSQIVKYASGSYIDVSLIGSK